MIDEYARKRIEGDYTYQSERLKNLFRAIYADPLKAWDKWEAYVRAQGFAKAELRFHRKPGRFGRQKGWLIMNFLPTRSYQQREMAKREAGRMIGQWGASHLQREQLEERITEAKQEAERVRPLREAARDARAGARVALREKTPKKARER